MFKILKYNKIKLNSIEILIKGEYKKYLVSIRLNKDNNILPSIISTQRLDWQSQIKDPPNNRAHVSGNLTNTVLVNGRSASAMENRT